MARAKRRAKRKAGRKKPARSSKRRTTKKKTKGSRKTKAANRRSKVKAKSKRRKPARKSSRSKKTTPRKYKMKDPTKIHSLFDYPRYKSDAITTLELEKERFFNALPRGTRCYCCGRYANLYDRKITDMMAVALVLIYGEFRRKPKLRWLHVERFLLARRGIPKSVRGDWHKFKYWGLIETKPELRDDDSPRNGYWRLTRKGRSFVRGKIRIPLSAFTYKDTLFGFAPPRISIYDALKEGGFDYSELMKR